MAEPERTPPDDTEGVRERYAEAAAEWALMYPLANWGYWGCVTGEARDHLGKIADNLAAAWGRDIADRMMAVRDEEVKRLRAELAEVRGQRDHALKAHLETIQECDYLSHETNRARVARASEQAERLRAELAEAREKATRLTAAPETPVPYAEHLGHRVDVLTTDGDRVRGWLIRLDHDVHLDVPEGRQQIPLGQVRHVARAEGSLRTEDLGGGR